MKAKHEQYLDALERIGAQMKEALDHDDVERFGALVEKRSALLPFIKAAFQTRDLASEPGWLGASQEIRRQSTLIHRALGRYDDRLLQAMRQARHAGRVPTEGRSSSAVA